MAVRSTVTTLNIRASPTTSAKKVGAMARGEIAILDPGLPAHAGGYVWYGASRLRGMTDLPALPTNPAGATQSPGWIAVGRESGGPSYVAPLGPRCPPVADFANIWGMLGAERLACLGGQSLSLDGTFGFGCDGCGGVGGVSFSPGWLGDGLTEYPLERGGTRFPIRFPPDVPVPAAASIVRVRGHFDDPRATECTASELDGPPIPASDAVAVCRQQFVVDSIVVESLP
jgi:hypothetical protein